MTNDPVPAPQPAGSNDLDLPLVDSVALRRLIEEVRQREAGDPAGATLYNRTYHRHNR
jgi:hypothetical protein